MFTSVHNAFYFNKQNSTATELEQDIDRHHGEHFISEKNIN